MRGDGAASLSLHCDYLFDGWEKVSGPGKCGRDWQVQGVTGGDDRIGRITSCGQYTAPTTRPPVAPVISASECSWGHQCTDSCSADLELALDGFPAP